METKVVGGRDTWWKVLEGAWVVGTCGLEFRCCNNTIQCKNNVIVLRKQSDKAHESGIQKRC